MLKSRSSSLRSFLFSHSSHAAPLLLAAVLLCVLCPGSGSAQTLARPGWVGSGLTTTVWWRHAVVYALDPRAFADSDGNGTGDLAGVAKRLDYLRWLGVDAVLLENVQPTGTQAVDPSIGTMSDFNALQTEAGRRGLRVLVELQPGKSGEDLTGASRFWLSQGVAGLALAPGGDAASRQAQIKQMRAAAASYIGERIVVGEQEVDSPARGRDAAQLVLAPLLPADSPVNAATMRTALQRRDTDENGPVRLRAIWAGDGLHDARAARALATVLFSGEGGVLVRAGEELGKVATPAAPVNWGVEAPAEQAAVSKTAKRPVPAPVPGDDVASQQKDPYSVLSWFKLMSELEHSNGAVRGSTDIVLDEDAANAVVWVRRPPSPSLKTPPVVTVCNLSDQPLKISLKDEMAKLHLRGTFLRKLQRTNEAMGALGLENVSLPAYAVFIGELQY